MNLTLGKIWGINKIIQRRKRELDNIISISLNDFDWFDLSYYFFFWYGDIFALKGEETL